MIQKLESFLVIGVMAAGAILPAIPFDVEGSTAPSEPLPCFLAGTQITMADGSHKNIKQVEVGDMVKSFNNGSIVVGEVTEVYSHSPDEMEEYYLVINDKLRVTPSHIIYVNGEWMPARNITEGDELLNSQNETMIVTSVERVLDQSPTYNLEILKYHTFFADDILVHNAKAPSEPLPPEEPTNNPPNIPGKPSGPTSVKTPPACFLAGTKITMADGSKKNIKQVRVGDMVKSYDHGEIVSGKVIEVFKHAPEEIDHYLKINDKLRVTPNHFIRVNGKWMPACQAGMGDKLLDESGEEAIIDSVEEVLDQSPTYNLEISEYHTFFANGILVHNAKAGYTYSSSTTDPDGDEVSYLFDWGDGSDSGWRGPYTSGTTAFATHLWSSPGTYYVKVKAKDEHGAVSGWSAPLTVHVNAPPTADFTYSPSSPTTEDNIQFTDRSYDSDGYIVSWNWNFGDGSTSTSQNPSHTYGSAGTYTVALTVEDDMGATDFVSKTIGITGIIKVAIYNVSELESCPDLHGKDIDSIGSEKWENTGTGGMERALNGHGFIKNGKRYRFKTKILEYYDIASGDLQNGNYKILLAPGDDDYWEDQLKIDGLGLKIKIRDFVNNGGGYIGTCGGAAFATQGYRWYEPGVGTGDLYDQIYNLCIVDAYAYTAPGLLDGEANRQYFYRSVIYENGTTEEGNGSGRSDWGGIPMENKFITNPPAPFGGYTEKTLRYWGGPWFELISGGDAAGIATYDKEPGNEPTTQLHDPGGDPVATWIKDEWSIITQDSIGEKGRIVLYGCHPEHYTWEWGDGQIIENSDYTEYIYCYPSQENKPPWNEVQHPRTDTSDIIQDSAVWIMEQML